MSSPTGCWELELMLDAFGERQAFLAMQNPLILDHQEYSSLEDVLNGFVCCRTVRAENGQQSWEWAPFSQKASQDFLDSYNKGFRHVSEILRARGLL